MPEEHKEHRLIRGFVFRLVKTRIAGSTLSSVLQEARQNDAKGLHTTITFLNDSVDDSIKARYNANAYVQLARQASRLHLKTDISLRLSQLGMGQGEDVLDMCLSDLIKALKDTDTRVWFESESKTDTGELLRIYRKYRSQYSNMGVEIPITYNLEVGAIRKLLKPHDMVKLTSYSLPGTVGAEIENDNGNGNGKAKAKGKNGKHAAKNEAKMRTKFILEHYMSNIGKLLQADVAVAILDHDEKLISQIAGFSKEYKKNLIFELPLGYSGNKLSRLMKLRINLSIYAPYGKDWTSYVVNRLTAGHGRIRQLAERVLEGADKEKSAKDEDER